MSRGNRSILQQKKVFHLFKPKKDRMLANIQGGMRVKWLALCLVLCFVLDSTAFASAAGAGEKDYQEGQKYDNRGEYKKALECLNRAIEKEPENFRYHTFRGRIYGAMEDVIGEMANAQELVRQFPDKSYSYLTRGALYAKQENFKAALEDFKKARDLFADGKRNYNLDHSFYFSTEPSGWHIGYFSQMIELEPNNVDLYMARLFSYSVAYPPYDIPKDEVRRDREQVIRLAPESATAYIMRGMLAEDEDEALAHYEKAISLDPADSSGYEMRGNFYYYRLKKHEQGIADYIKIYRMFPSSGRYYGDQLIRMCKGAGLYEVGEAFLKEEIQKSPNDYKIHELRSKFYKEFGKDELALQDIERIITLVSEEDRNIWHNNRIRLLEKLGMKEELLAEYNRQIEEEPENARYYRQRSVFYYEQGNPAAALADQELSVRYFSVKDYPSEDLAFRFERQEYQYRGLLYYKLGEYEKAADDFTKVLELERKMQEIREYYPNGRSVGIAGLVRLPTEENTYLCRAKAYYELKEYPKALADLEEALRLAEEAGDFCPGQYRWEPLYWNGLIYEKTGKKEKALGQYEKYIVVMEDKRSVDWLERFCTDAERVEYNANHREVEESIERLKKELAKEK
jgi:Putative Zn-dependent protease, contains TPR repeats